MQDAPTGYGQRGMDEAASLPQLPAGPVTSIEGAIAQMTAIAGELPLTDGLACFNRMYLIVTEKVLSEVSTGAYADPAFLSDLDVVFVNLYFGAIEAWQAEPQDAPRCWSELLASRSDTHIAPMQFALAGMNAHINHDLPIAVVKTCEELDTAPDEGTHAADFEKVNAVLGALDQQIRESFETGIILDLDRMAAGLENVIGNFAIDEARRAAWINADALWRLRDHPFLSKEYTDGLDDAAALAARALLVPLL
ncbi:MAG: DUF5995 family protein [Acidimicrobiales bacterium]|jgi:hypothetical protein